MILYYLVYFYFTFLTSSRQNLFSTYIKAFQCSRIKAYGIYQNKVVATLYLPAILQMAF